LETIAPLARFLLIRRHITGETMHFDSNDETLKRYLDDIRKTAPLGREEEQELFKQAKKGNKAARAKLISANMRFVLKVAIQYRGCPIPLPDLVSEGAMGLVRAIESFDHSRGLKFISYAVWWIKAYITRAINENGSLIRLPANQHLRVRKALKEQSKGKEIAEDIRELIQLGERGISFDSPLKSDTKTTFSEVLADNKAMSPEAESEIMNIENLTRELLGQLPPREARVIAGIFGINQEAPQTLREVGESMGISHERVRQLRDQALRRIRKLNSKDYLKEKYEGFLDAIKL
jgi:RNA polymerase primary sigma factor